MLSELERETARESDAVTEARRVMQICNACRYCEGLCATFQSMVRKREFPEPELDYLANLCHNCTACFHVCPYSPPHLIDLNVPQSLTALRVETYEKYAWPGFLATLLRRNGLAVSMVTAFSLSLVLVLVIVLRDASVLFSSHVEAGSFYEVIGQNVMIAVAGGTFGFSILAMFIGVVRFWFSTQRSSRVRVGIGSLLRALWDVVTLKNLGGGHNEGCTTRDESYSNQRRVFHQFTMWGFLFCFVSTSVAAFYDHMMGWVAPYPLLSVPVVFGSLGGLGLLIGPPGLLWVKLQSDSRPMLLRHYGMDYAFLALLFFISLTGLLLLALRETSAMGIVLAVHLGFVLGFFLLMPYCKFVHGIYRFAALVRFHGKPVG
ncbi:hypothetical protein Pan216_19650 [Planctomycetes bacterium Pan216]|uniref:4Fe-4S ferredoxin-type domain-containing protein n=1 Tax=Kolteria novifilia TaxID=2527975 RepID=A0A518B295_9BACT|nr:hypothetical protein Pan216_19650 [Planctomycetes bacterium Pan216]